MTQGTWRTLVRVVTVEHTKNVIHVVIPGRHPGIVYLPFKDVPINIRQLAIPGKRFHAKVNIGAILVEDLTFSDWEVE